MQSPTALTSHLFSFSCIIPNSCASSSVFLSSHVLLHAYPSLMLTPRLVLSSSASCSLLLMAAQTLMGAKADGGDVVPNSDWALSLLCYRGVQEDACGKDGSWQRFSRCLRCFEERRCWEVPLSSSSGCLCSKTFPSHQAGAQTTSYCNQPLVVFNTTNCTG